MKIYVGNLSYEVTEEGLRDVFSSFGEVTSAIIIKDQFSGKSKGFGFVEMSSQDEAKAAINDLNEKELQGRKLTVSEARPRADKPGGRGGRPGGGGGRPGGGGGRHGGGRQGGGGHGGGGGRRGGNQY